MDGNVAQEQAPGEVQEHTAGAAARALCLATGLCVLIFAVLFAALGGAQSDGRVVHAALELGVPGFVQRWAHEMGRPAMALVLGWATVGSAEFAPAALGALAWVVASLAAAMAVRAWPGSTTSQSCVAAAVVAMNPAGSILLMSTAAVQYPLGYALYFCGMWAAVRAGRDQRPWARQCLDVLTVLLAVASVLMIETAAVMIWLYPWVRAGAAGQWPRQGTGSTTRGSAALSWIWPVLRYPWAAVASTLTLAAYLMSNPPSGYFVAERAPQQSVSAVLLGAAMFVVALVVAHALLLLVVLAMSAGRGRQAVGSPVDVATRNLRVAGWCSLLLAALPYVAMGRQASFSGWHARHLLFACVAVGLWLMAWLRAPGVAAAAGDRDRGLDQGDGRCEGRCEGRIQARLAGALLAALALAMLARWAGLAERVVKNDAFMAAVSQRAPLPAQTLLCVLDQHPVAGRYINLSEWSAMAQWAGQQPEALALTVTRWPAPQDVQRQLADLRSGTRVYFWTGAPWATQCTMQAWLPDPPNRMAWYLTVAQAVVYRWAMQHDAYRNWLLGRYGAGMQPVTLTN